MKININVDDNRKKIDSPYERGPSPVQATMTLNARENLNGDIMIFDHRDIDIILMPSKRKIVAFAKEAYGDQVYSSINRLFEFLLKKGVIEPDSVRGGNIYSSMEAKIPKSEKYNSLQVVLYTIAKFIEEELPYLEYEKAWEKELEKMLTAPGPEDSTELDPDRHAPTKGSLRPGMRPFGIANIYRL